MEIPVVVYGVVLDPTSNSPIIILKDEFTNRILPIWVGIFEANAIAMKLEGVSTPRPMTHDLLKNVIEKMGAKVERIVVDDLKDGTFYGKIYIKKGEDTLKIDSRPSDAIALAVRVGAPIFVEEKVFKEASIVGTTEGLPDGEDLKDWLENLSPDDLGKYKM